MCNSLLNFIKGKNASQALSLFKELHDQGTFKYNCYVPISMIKSGMLNENQVFEIYNSKLVKKDGHLLKAMSFYIADNPTIPCNLIGSVLTDMKQHNYPCDIGPSKMIDILIKNQRDDIILDHLPWLEQNSMLMTSVISQFGLQHENLNVATKIFNCISSESKTISIYNAMMKVFNKHKKYNESVNLYRKHFCESSNDAGSSKIRLNDISFTILFNACCNTLNIEIGNQLYYFWENDKCCFNNITCNALIDMFGNFGELTKAIQVFNKINNPDMITYGCLMNAYNKNNAFDQTLQVFMSIRKMKLKIDLVCYSLALKAAGKSVSLKQGKKVASHLIKHLDSSKINNHVWSSLISMNGKCGNYKQAIQIFDKIKENNCDCIIYNSILDVYSKMGDIQSVLKLYNEMQNKGICPVCQKKKTRITKYLESYV